jgi:cytochrome c oxidase subunit 3
LLYVSNHYWWIFVGSAGNGKISLKVSMGLLRQGGSLLQFVDKEGHRVALADFAVNLHEERAVNPDKAKWFMGEGSLPSFL